MTFPHSIRGNLENALPCLLVVPCKEGQGGFSEQSSVGSNQSD